MRAFRTTLVAAFFVVAAASSVPAGNEDQRERNASKIIRSRVTGDGSTVGEVISYVANKRPKRFTFSKIVATRLGREDLYDVFVCFFNGNLRGDDREDCATNYSVSLSPISITIPGDAASNPAHALEKGKAAYLVAVDREYDIYCGGKPPDRCNSED